MDDKPEWKKPKIKEVAKFKPHGSAPIFADVFVEKTKTPRWEKHPEWFNDSRGGILFLRYFNKYFSRFELPRKTRLHHVNKVSADAVDRAVYKHPIEGIVKFPKTKLDDVVKINALIRTIPSTYNTEDGLARWLIDIGLGRVYPTNVWPMIPDEVRKKMPKWRRLYFPAEKAVHQFSQLKDMDDSYNTIDGPVRWLEDHGYEGMNVYQFWQNIPRDVRSRMTRWTLPYGWSFKEAKEGLGKMEKMRLILVRAHHFEDPFAEKRMTTLLLRTHLSDQEVESAVTLAFKYANALVTQLSRARLKEPEQQEFSIEEMHELYTFAQKHFSLPPEAVWLILRIKKMNLRGVTSLVRYGDRDARRDLSLSTPISNAGENNSTIEDRLGHLDPGFSRVEARMVLEKISESGHLSEEQTKILDDVISGRDLEDEEYKHLAEATQTHPELLELLGIGYE